MTHLVAKAENDPASEADAPMIMSCVEARVNGVAAARHHALRSAQGVPHCRWAGGAERRGRRQPGSGGGDGLFLVGVPADHALLAVGHDAQCDGDLGA